MKIFFQKYIENVFVYTACLTVVIVALTFTIAVVAKINLDTQFETFATTLISAFVGAATNMLLNETTKKPKDELKKEEVIPALPGHI